MTYSIPEVRIYESLNTGSNGDSVSRPVSRESPPYSNQTTTTAYEAMMRDRVLNPFNRGRRGFHRELEEIIDIISRELRQDTSITQNLRWLDRPPTHNAEDVILELREWAAHHRVDISFENGLDRFRIYFRASPTQRFDDTARGAPQRDMALQISIPSVSSVEKQLGVNSDMWDTLEAEDIIKAVFEVIQYRERRNEQRNQASSRFRIF